MNVVPVLTSAGYHPAIQQMDRNNIHILHTAKIGKGCHEMMFCLDISRKHFYILENSLEWGTPMPKGTCGPFGLGTMCTSNWYSKMYFDEGYFKKGFLFKIGFFRGEAFFQEGVTEYVCCCVPCCAFYNQCVACYFPRICGERVVFQSSSHFCWCIPSTACWLHNCFGCCGPKNGEIVGCNVCGYSCTGTGMLVTQLMQGEAAVVKETLTKARREWNGRTGIMI